MATLTLKQLKKTYANGHQALHGIDLSIHDGEFVVIVGPSGCGKSTLLRMVAGLEDISSGDLYIDDRRVNEVAASDRDIAMVFQNYALYPHMTVFDNMAYGLKIRKIGKDEIQARVKEAAEILGLTAVLDRKPQQLSGGQRQRVAMGRAIVRSPKLFLFDEPLSNLDAKLRVQMRLEMQALHRRLKTTSLYVTHDQVEAMTLAERIVILNAGHIEQVGTPDEIYHQPASIFVAQFIGSPPMNLLNVQQDAQGAWHTKSTSLPISPTSAARIQATLQATLQAPMQAPMQAPIQGAVQQPASTQSSETTTQHQTGYWLGVRPEHVRLYPQGSAEVGAGDICFDATVMMQELLGAERLVYTTVAGETMIVRCGNEDAIAQQLQVDQPCQLVCDQSHLYWFDAAGKRL